MGAHGLKHLHLRKDRHGLGRAAVHDGRQFLYLRVLVPRGTLPAFFSTGY
jgi:hypothetical protein